MKKLQLKEMFDFPKVLQVACLSGLYFIERGYEDREQFICLTDYKASSQTHKL